MKKRLLQIFIGVLILSCSSAKKINNLDADKRNKKITHDYFGKIAVNELNFIKTNYNWNSTRILIINYKQPLYSCHFDNHKITDGNKWWENFYSKIDTENCSNIHVLASGEKYLKNIDNKSIFDDKNDFLFKIFFRRKTSCFGVLVINNEGDYLQFNGHYSESQVSKYIEDLR